MPTYTLADPRPANVKPAVSARNTVPVNTPARTVAPRAGQAVAPQARSLPARPMPARTASTGNQSRKSPPLDAAPDKILFQSYFKSVGPRTYASQVKLLKNDNHMLVLTVGRPNPDGGEPIKTRLVVFAEDFVAFFRLLQETAQFIKANPLPEKVRVRRQKFWEKQATSSQRSPRL